MTEMRDPIEIYRESLGNVPVYEETVPPTIERAEVWPYPDLMRLWVRVQVSRFAQFPNLAFEVTDPDGAVVASLYMVEIREPYQSITLHLRPEPRPGATYCCRVELIRDEQLLDEQAVDFELTYRDPQA
jgi:hypothetical protein